MITLIIKSTSQGFAVVECKEGQETILTETTTYDEAVVKRNAIEKSKRLFG